MSLFAKHKSAPAAPPAPAPVKSAVQPLTQLAIRTQLEKYRVGEIETLPVVVGWESTRARCVRYYKATEKVLATVDTARLSAGDQQLLRKFVYADLPAAAETLAREALIYWARDVGHYDSAGEAMIVKLQEEVAQLVLRQRMPDYKFVPATIAEPELQALAFPAHHFENQKLATALARLEAAWRTACQRHLGVEERYLLGQIATSYLPDSWRLIQGFETYPPDLRARVEAHVLEQLELLSAQVEELLNRDAEVLMGAIEAHTGFLRAKQARAQPSKLHLSAKIEAQR